MMPPAPLMSVLMCVQTCDEYTILRPVQCPALSCDLTHEQYYLMSDQKSVPMSDQTHDECPDECPEPMRALMSVLMSALMSVLMSVQTHDECPDQRPVSCPVLMSVRRPSLTCEMTQPYL